MSLIWFDGFEQGWAVSGGEPGGPGGYTAMTVGGGGGNSISTSWGRNGSIGARFNNSGGAASMYAEKDGLAIGNEFLMQCASVRHSGTATMGIMGVREGALRHIELWWEGTTGNLLVLRNGVLIADLPTNPLTGIALGVYHFIECKVRIHDTTGYIIIRVDGIEIANVTGIDTLTLGGTGACDTFWIMSRYATSGVYNIYYDDFALCAIDGVAPVAASGDWLGDAREVRLTPTGAGNSTQFTPSAGSNWQNVDETNADEDTTYNYESTVGEKDTFALSDIPTPVTVLGVRQMLRARKDDTGVRTARMVRRVGGTDYEGSDLNLLESYQTFYDLLVLNPNTGLAWTEADVNGMEAGYKVQA